MNNIEHIKQLIADQEIQHTNFILYAVFKDIFGFRYALYARKKENCTEFLQEAIGFFKFLKLRRKLRNE